MIEKIRIIFSIPELRRKILLTLALLHLSHWISHPLADDRDRSTGRWRSWQLP